jgi:predicted peroxiredoxin
LRRDRSSWLLTVGEAGEMKSRIIVYLIAIITQGAPVVTYPEDDFKLFVALTTSDTQTQLMALVLTTQVTRQKGTAQILLCSSAGDLALKGSKEAVLKPLNKSPQMLLKSLIASGVTVQVCPLYMPNKGLTADDLIEGVTEAKPALIAEKLQERGVKLFTF